MDYSAKRAAIRAQHTADEALLITQLTTQAAFAPEFHDAAHYRAVGLVNAIRNDKKPSLMEVFLAEYGLSTEEGVSLMCLAEALLRVPDATTIDALIEDKIAPSEWAKHLGNSSSPLVNASTWGLMLTGKVLTDGQGVASVLRGVVRRLGEPVIRKAVARAMKELGAQFVLGQTIEAAVKRGQAQTKRGYTYSYDMLGEAAMTADDAQAFYDAYADAIERLSASCIQSDIRDNPGISIKLSALHPRYEFGQADRVMRELVPLTLGLAQQAKAAGMGLNIDAEEADRLDLSLDVIEAVLSDPSLAGWDGFGVVVQAYGKRAAATIDWLYALAQKLDRKIMVRLVKGAYWDTEIKRAQVEGLNDYPVFTKKRATDVSYLCCAQKLLGYTDRIYPQFATHNAHSIAAILEMGAARDAYEFQRLHGMGEALHDVVVQSENIRCRIYAPVGTHEDLLAYLVRRLLENGANSSFVNQIVDKAVPAEVVAASPFEDAEAGGPVLPKPVDIYAPERLNSRGWDLYNTHDVDQLEAARLPYHAHVWDLRTKGDEQVDVFDPAAPQVLVGKLTYMTEAQTHEAIARAVPWNTPAAERADVLRKAANLYEAHFGELFALLAREAGKTAMDAVGELREAVDFLRYYAARSVELAAPARGIFTCISPWNFPLAIFTGQIAGALAAGNGVLAKPAEATSLIALRATELLREAGVPAHVLQLLPGRGDVVGKILSSDAQIDGICFTGSTATAQSINRAMSTNLSPHAPLIAETGGLNAMIVDSTALPEQAVRDIVASAFQSAGQRCSALRVLYVQQDVADKILTMLYGAMDELRVSAPWDLATDLGPAIDAVAKSKIDAHIETAQHEGRLLHEVSVPSEGHFVAPSVIRVNGISDLREEIFGPVLHVAIFSASDLKRVMADINATGYGLTFGMHSRIDDRIALASRSVNAGNIYINRNQIGAVVGSQPFGGEGMSGTGPKAGGPNYVARFTKPEARTMAHTEQRIVATDRVQAAIDAGLVAGTALDSQVFPGPTGESNRMTTHGRGTVLCLGPGPQAAAQQAEAAEQAGCYPVMATSGLLLDGAIDGEVPVEALSTLNGFAAVVSFASREHLRTYRVALAGRDGALIPLLSEGDFACWLTHERHVCVDTTAAGGNAQLLNAGS